MKVIILAALRILSLAAVLFIWTKEDSYAQNPQSLPEELLKSFFQKRQATIAVTDSGLGGLAVVAETAMRMKEGGVFQTVNLVFFNALFSLEGGYNSLRSREERIQVFDSALQSLKRNYKPDLIIIGCNTLSVIYEETPFSKKTDIPVVGIIEAGVELISRNLHKNSNSAAILFATPTTIKEGTHKKLLLKQGFAGDRIIEHACPELESYIEKGLNSEETEMLIGGFVDESLQKIPAPRPPILVSLNCTHYGYSLPLWVKAFEASGVKPAAILNPNSRMIDFLFGQDYLERFPKTEIAVRAVSMVEINKEKIDSLGEWLLKISAETAASLSRYELKPDLFEWKKFIQ